MDEGTQRSPAPPLYLHIFLASPGDVLEERTIAREVIEALPKDALLRDKIAVDMVTWDGPGGPAMEASMTPQAAIQQGLRLPSKCDVTVVILWSRMGTPLPTDWQVKPDGTPFRSGTEWEYLEALEGSKKNGRPKVLVYRRNVVPSIALDDPALDQKMKQWAAVQAFFAEFTNLDGSLKGAYSEYDEPLRFKDKLESDLRDVVKRMLDAEPAVAEQPASPAHNALLELNQLGDLILKLYYFKSIAERLHDLYMDKEVRFLRSQPAQSLPKQSLRRAARSGETALEDIRALDEPKLLPSEKKAKDSKLSRLDAALEELIAAVPVPASEGAGEGAEEAIGNFTYELTTLRDSFNKLAEDSWTKLALGELGTTFARVRDPLSSNYPGYMARVDAGYRAITGQPPLFATCNLLANEHELLEKALKELSALERLLEANFSAATLTSTRPRINGFMQGARTFWDQFVSAAPGKDDWALALLNSGGADWSGIDKCRETMDAMLEKAEQCERQAFLNILREAQENIEPHFQAVDEALAGAFREVKNRLGEALTAVPAGAEA
jgi:hypothetical protein